MIARANRCRHQSGLTLVELMVAMVLGLLVAAGIITIFLSTSASVKAQDQLAVLQESGRYAMARLADDIGMANSQYCSSGGGVPLPTNPGGTPGPSLDGLRAPKVFVNGSALFGALSDVTTPWGSGAYPAAPTAPFAIPEYLSMRGYACDKNGNCSPGDPAAAGLPGQGQGVGDRVVGSSVLTLRYLDPTMGWSIGMNGGSSVTVGGGGNAQAISSINLHPLPGEPGPSTFGAGHLAMLADCSLSQVFAVTGQGSATLVPAASPSPNFTQPSPMTGGNATRLFDFNNAFKTVTYYLKVVDAGGGRTTGALIRRLNGQDQELVRGVERLDFSYGVLQRDGAVRYLTATQVDNSINCPWDPMADAVSKTNRAGCMWRAVVSIETNLLMSGQAPLYSLGNSELAYSYATDGITTPAPPSAHPIDPETDQGFPTELFRREFTALHAIRNYNP